MQVLLHHTKPISSNTTSSTRQYNKPKVTNRIYAQHHLALRFRAAIQTAIDLRTSVMRGWVDMKMTPNLYSYGDVHKCERSPSVSAVSASNMNLNLYMQTNVYMCDTCYITSRLLISMLKMFRHRMHERESLYFFLPHLWMYKCVYKIFVFTTLHLCTRVMIVYDYAKIYIALFYTPPAANLWRQPRRAHDAWYPRSAVHA